MFVQKLQNIQTLNTNSPCKPDSTLDRRGVWQTSVAKLVSMECGDVINISDVSVWVSGLGSIESIPARRLSSLDLQLLDTMDMLLFAISEEYFNISWTSSTNKIRSIDLIKVYSAI